MLARVKTKAKLAKRPTYPILLQLRRWRDELNQVVTAPQDERHQRLASLRRKLETTMPPESSQSPRSPPSGLRTLVRHYRNEQAEPLPTSSHP